MSLLSWYLSNKKDIIIITAGFRDNATYWTANSYMSLRACVIRYLNRSIKCVSKLNTLPTDKRWLNYDALAERDVYNVASAAKETHSCRVRIWRHIVNYASKFDCKTRLAIQSNRRHGKSTKSGARVRTLFQRKNS